MEQNLSQSISLMRNEEFFKTWDFSMKDDDDKREGEGRPNDFFKICVCILLVPISTYLLIKMFSNI